MSLCEFKCGIYRKILKIGKENYVVQMIAKVSCIGIGLLIKACDYMTNRCQIKKEMQSSSKKKEKGEMQFLHTHKSETELELNLSKASDYVRINNNISPTTCIHDLFEFDWV